MVFYGCVADMLSHDTGRYAELAKQSMRMVLLAPQYRSLEWTLLPWPSPWVESVTPGCRRSTVGIMVATLTDGAGTVRAEVLLRRFQAEHVGVVRDSRLGNTSFIWWRRAVHEVSICVDGFDDFHVVLAVLLWKASCWPSWCSCACCGPLLVEPSRPWPPPST